MGHARAVDIGIEQTHAAAVLPALATTDGDFYRRARATSDATDR
jgi:hypothetical protein